MHFYSYSFRASPCNLTRLCAPVGASKFIGPHVVHSRYEAKSVTEKKPRVEGTKRPLTRSREPAAAVRVLCIGPFFQLRRSRLTFQRSMARRLFSRVTARRASVVAAETTGANTGKAATGAIAAAGAGGATGAHAPSARAGVPATTDGGGASTTGAALRATLAGFSTISTSPSPSSGSDTRTAVLTVHLAVEAGASASSKMLASASRSSESKSRPPPMRSSNSSSGAATPALASFFSLPSIALMLIELGFHGLRHHAHRAWRVRRSGLDRHPCSKL